MESNKEIKIALVVGAVMLTICIVAFIINYRNLHPKLSTLDIKVYKHVMLNEETKQGTYVECTLPTDELAKANIEFKKIMNLEDDKKVQSTLNNTINGDYKITSGSNFIAFDISDNQLVYRSDTTALYGYRSSLFENVERLCSNISKETIVANTEEQ